MPEDDDHSFDSNMISKSRNTIHCEVCGKVIHPGELYYNRNHPTSPIKKCISCFKNDRKKWQEQQIDYDKLTDKIKRLIFTQSATSENISKLCKKDVQRRAINYLNENGYHTCWIGTALVLEEFPEIYDFISDIFSVGPEYCYPYDLYEKYENYWITALICIVKKWPELTADFSVNVNDHGYELRSKEYMYSHSTVYINTYEYFQNACKKIGTNDSFRQMLLRKRIIVSANGTYKFNSNLIDYEKIQDDDSIYLQVCEDNRMLIMSVLIDSVFHECDNISVLGPEKILFHNEERSYDIILDEHLLNENPITDYNIVMLEGEIICFDNVNMTDPQSFEECFEQEDNELVIKLLRYIIDLKESGF